jgi:single-strand DNA-binding protein
VAGETLITVIGNLAGDPELRFTPSGQAVCNFTIATTPRTFDKQAQDWRDGETLFLRCNVWREAAENVHESLGKGARVIAHGKLKARSFETKEGERRTVFELEVEEIGPSLRYARARVDRNGNGQGGGAPTSPDAGGSTSYGGPPAGQDDPWAVPADGPAY